MDEAVRIRAARDHADFAACVRLQREVWGLCDLEITSTVQLVATVHAGGLLLLAEDAAGEAVGFGYAFAGLAGGEPYLHSDMLAVRPGARGHGVGRRLKWAQREEALRRGLRLVQWTFDPMRARERAPQPAPPRRDRARVPARPLRPHVVGPPPRPAHRPTCWRAGSSTRRESGSLAAGAPREAAAVARGAATTIEIPADWDETATDPARAADEQSRVRRAFEEAFAAGYEAVDFVGDPSGRCFYLLRPRT